MASLSFPCDKHMEKLLQNGLVSFLPWTILCVTVFFHYDQPFFKGTNLTLILSSMSQEKMSFLLACQRLLTPIPPKCSHNFRYLA